MRIRTLAVLAVVVLSCAASVLAEKKEKGPADASPLRLWGAKGQTLIVRQYVPGLNAALMLSQEQVIKLYEAFRETVDSPELHEKGKVLKTNPNVTEAERKQFQAAHEAAQALLESKVAAILTPAQRELMQSLELLYRQARESAREGLAADFALVKADKTQAERVNKLYEERFEADFKMKLRERLSSQQYAATEKAAEVERARDAESAAKKKQ